MNIKLMLARLQNALGREDLIEQMVLLQEPITSCSQKAKSAKSVNFIVGYNSSPKSHTALDISLLIAHQTRLATKAHVTVQAVYVLEDYQTSDFFDILPNKNIASNDLDHESTFKSSGNYTSRSNYTRVLTPTNKFAQAERILWQARCLAEEWQSYFKAHLRFGSIADELKKVVISEAATLVFLGCNSAQHPIIQKLGRNFPCPVLGIPYSVYNEGS